MIENVQRPTSAFIGASWLALIVGAAAFMIGLGNASMDLNEKGYYFTILMYGLFAAVSLQKSVRDRFGRNPRHQHLFRALLALGRAGDPAPDCRSLECRSGRERKGFLRNVVRPQPVRFRCSPKEHPRRRRG